MSDNFTTDRNPVSNLRMGIPSPRLLTGFILQLLQWKFSKVDYLHNVALRDPKYLWVPNDYDNQKLEKGILIDQSSRYSPQDSQQRPAVLVKQGPQTLIPQLRTIGGYRLTPSTHLLGDGHDPNVVPTLGQDMLVHPISGTHTIYCIGTTGDAAEVLGTEIWFELLDRSKNIREDCSLSRLDINNLSEAAQLEESQTNWVTTIMINYIYQRNTLLSQEAPLLRGFVAEPNVHN